MLLAVFCAVAHLALDEADGVGDDGEYDGQVFGDALWAAREIDDEGLPVYPGNRP